MKTLKSLYLLAEAINKSWIELERLDWSEAEQLVEECKKIPQEQLADLLNISEIITYANEYEDWDSGEVANWPEVIRTDIECADKCYDYQAEGENWEIFSISLIGEKEWKATAETECLAIKIVDVLNPT